MEKFWERWRWRVAMGGLMAVIAMPAAWSCQSLPRPQPTIHDDCSRAPASDTLRVVTFNIAHGRGTSFHQVLEPSERFEPQLVSIAAVVAAVSPDVVALQEADAPSSWSGNLDHVEAVADSSGACGWTRGTHVHTDVLGRTTQYGTALVSSRPMRGAYSAAFDTSLVDTKGFVEAEVDGPTGPTLLVSTHLDPASDTIRGLQIDQLVARYRKRDRPLVLMGDLNCSMDGPDRCVGRLAAALDLEVCGVPSYPAASPSRAIDWILVSRELSITSCERLDGVVSDHRAVLAVLRARTPSDR